MYIYKHIYMHVYRTLYIYIVVYMNRVIYIFQNLISPPQEFRVIFQSTSLFVKLLFWRWSLARTMGTIPECSIASEKGLCVSAKVVPLSIYWDGTLVFVSQCCIWHFATTYIYVYIYIYMYTYIHIFSFSLYSIYIYI